jgi:hypothetical protein
MVTTCLCHCSAVEYSGELPVRFKRVDNLVACSIRSETGLFIPSDSVNNHLTLSENRLIP